jgi:hypothetical protein
MAAFDNLSFEQVGASPGAAFGWTWTRQVSMAYASYASAGGVSRAEDFEFGWNNFPFVGSLVAPTNAQTAFFGEFGLIPAPFEDFEREWYGVAVLGVPVSSTDAIVVLDSGIERFPSAGSFSIRIDREILIATAGVTWAVTRGARGTVAAAHAYGAMIEFVADPTEPGNAAAFFVWESAGAALFGGTLSVEDFEQGWHSNEAYLWRLASTSLHAAAFGGGAAHDSFESGWKGNATYRFVFAFGSLHAATFMEYATTQSFEDFSAVRPDQPITYSAPNTIVCPADIFPTGLLSPPTNARATFYNVGGVGALPPELDPRLTYFILVGIGTTQFQASIAPLGSPIPFSAFFGNNFFKSDTTRFWTLTDVGI